MVCPKCGTENESRMYFCASCGFDLTVSPPSYDVSVTSRRQSLPYAVFWRRLVALLLDSAILMIGGGIMGAVVGVLIGIGRGAAGANPADIQATLSSLSNVLGLLINWLYFTLFESSSKQATPGKMAMGIVVTDMQGKPVSFGRANGRYWGKIVSALILFIGFFMAAFTRKRQALHDIMASTLVLHQSPSKRM